MSNTTRQIGLEVKSLWNKACQHEGIDVKSPFVVFSDTNPHAATYNSKMSQFQTALQQDQLRANSVSVL